ncbi:unnamed protein product [Adineta steineri]|uniref:Apple domain-containing protein n=2 Tax=Adineta steineri TaxID=433720 RepID=A0A815FJH0_9BILA|nr:unnamed protein product [Adineta steineri]
MRWCEGKEEGEVVVGGNGERNQLNLPSGLSFDDKGNLHVADYDNHRILRYFLKLKAILVMYWKRNYLFLLFIFITQIITQDIRSFHMSEMIGWQFECANTTCLPFSTATVSNIRQCRINCLAQVQCKAVSFHQSTSKCELFANITNGNVNMLANADIITMIVIDTTQTPLG